jgi:DNA polymerase-4
MRPRHILHVRLALPTDAAGGLYPHVLDTLQNITPRVQPLPQGAAVLDVTGALRYWERDARGIAHIIQLRTAALFGLHTTIGAGGNRLLAAMAAASSEPGGLTVIEPTREAAAAFLRPQPATALLGLGPTTAQTLATHGLHTIGALADTPPLTLQRLLGTATGRRLHERAHGHDPTPVTPEPIPRSIDAEHLFTADTLDPDQHRRGLLTLAVRLGAHLRATDQVTGTLTLTVRYADHTATTRSRVLAEPTAHTHALTTTAYALHDTLSLQRARVRALTLRADNLTDAAHAPRQLSLDPATERRRRAEAAADRVRRRFGPRAAHPAGLIDTTYRTAAPLSGPQRSGRIPAGRSGGGRNSGQAG